MEVPRKVLLVSSSASGAALAEELERHNWHPLHADSAEAAAALMRQHAFNVGLLLLDDAHPHEAAKFEACISTAPECEWVGVFPSGCSARAPWREIILTHFFDHHTYPADIAFLCRSLGHAYGRSMLRKQTGSGTGTSAAAELGMVGQSEAIQKLRSLVRKVGTADAPVLIGGESGSGKELVAHALHKASSRASGPFVAVNCGALAPTLIHSELFGHERGSFSGASTQRRGLIESAQGGTLFLDEIAELPLDLQATLLRFLQEKTIVRVGGGRAMEADTRVIAASHVDLEEAAAAGRFRQDLYFRLSVLVLQVPALRERKEDIPLLARHFHEQISRARPTRAKGFSPQGMAALLAHDWPGNVRELYNRVQRAVVMADNRLIGPSDLGLLPAPTQFNSEGLQQIRVQAEKTAICHTLQRVSHNITLAARDLGVSRMTLYRLMAKHSITPGAV